MFLAENVDPRLMDLMKAKRPKKPPAEPDPPLKISTAERDSFGLGPETDHMTIPQLAEERKKRKPPEPPVEKTD